MCKELWRSPGVLAAFLFLIHRHVSWLHNFHIIKQNLNQLLIQYGKEEDDRHGDGDVDGPSLKSLAERCLNCLNWTTWISV